MKYLMKKFAVSFIAAASVASIAHADSSIPAKPELVEIDVTVTKDHGETGDLRQSNSGSWFRRTVKTEVDAYATPTTKVSMRTEIDKPSVTSARRIIKFRSAMAKSNDEIFSHDSYQETSVGVDAAYIPAASSAPVKPELEYAHVLVSIDDLINLEKFRLTDAKDDFIDLPSIKSVRIAVPVVPGDINTVKRGDYTVTVTERTLSN
jgi:hypothetical protein